ncbi:MAG: hypothetical protein BMS9Abin04_440 [Planctomycetia bacterium]|nr:MAG: hypothetical protein BMS9Abin04_440 [Planctomycetia bacterium]
MQLAQLAPDYTIILIGIAVLGMLLLASFAVLVIFLAVRQRTWSVGMTLLGLLAALVVGVVALAFVRFGAGRQVVPGRLNTASTHLRYHVPLDDRASVTTTVGGRGPSHEQRSAEAAQPATPSRPAAGSAPPAALVSSATKPPDQATPLPAATAPSAAKPSVPPEWVQQPPGRSGTVFRRVVRSDPFTTDEECYHQLDGKMLVVACRYLADRVGNGWQRSFDQITDERAQFDLARRRLGSLGVDAAYLWKNACKQKEYREFIASSVNDVGDAQLGPMRRIHALLEFDEPVERFLVQSWENRERVERLGLAGVCAAAVLGLIGVVFVYLKIDTATRGFYSRRLKAAAVLATILIIVVFLGVVSP